MKKQKTKKKRLKKLPVDKVFWQDWRIYVILILVGIVYWPTLDFSITNWDDNVYTTENILINSDRGINLSSFFNTPVSGNYHPITMLSLAIDSQIAGMSARQFHLTNVIFHILNVFLVFWFISRLSNNRWLGLGTAFLFGLHPMHVESVAWIAERKDVLYVFFLMSGLISYLEYSANKKLKWYFITFIFALLAILAKAMAVIFPLLLVLIDLFKSSKSLLDIKVWLSKTPFFLLSVLFGVIALNVQTDAGAVSTMDTFTIFQRLLYATHGLGQYIIKFFVPVNLSAFYPYPPQNLPLPLAFYFYPAIAGVFVYILIKYKKQKPIVFGFWFFIFSVLLVLQLISVGQVIMADRYTYLAYAGLAFAFLSFVLAGTKNLNTTNNRIFMGIVGLWLGWTTYQTVQRVKVWEDNETLWSSVINQYPNRIAVAYKNRGNHRAQLGNIEAAEKDLNTSLTLNPNDGDIYESLGNIAGLQGNHTLAKKRYDQAIGIDGVKPTYYVNRGIANCLSQNYSQGFDDFRKALELEADEGSVLQNRAYFELVSGKLKEAISDYKRLISLYPKQGSHHYFLSQAYFNQNRFTEAKVHLLKANQLGYEHIDRDYESQLMSR